MSSGIIAMMIGVSTFLGVLGLSALLWAIKTGQFDDREKFLDAAKFDDEEALRDAAAMDERRKAAKNREKSYSPPD
jgi:cbb3-type cytochrome oxidase maturation protein